MFSLVYNVYLEEKKKHELFYLIHFNIFSHSTGSEYTIGWILLSLGLWVETITQPVSKMVLVLYCYQLVE